MPAIPFSLQPVLSYKRSLVDLLQRQLGQLLSERRRLAAFLAALRQEDEEQRDLLSGQQRGILNVERIRLHYVYLDWLGQRIDALQSQIAQLETRIEEKRAELLRATQDRDMLEKLRQRAEERFMAELERREAIFHDEIATTRFARARREGR